MTTSRNIRRRKEKLAKKELKKKMNMFGRLPDECSSCLDPFDKTDKEMVMSWSVVVREKEKIVRLYCPDCWGAAQQVVKEFADGQEDAEGNV